MHSVGMEQKQVKWNVSNCLFNQYMVISDPRHTESQSAQISQMQDEYNVYAIMKTMCPPGHHHNGFVEHSSVHWYQQCVTVHHVPVHELPQSHCGNNWGGTLLSRLHAIVAITGKVGGYIVFIALPVIYIYIYIYIYAIIKTMCPPGYRHNGFVTTYALGHMMYGYTLLVPMNRRVLNKLSKEHKINGHK